MGNGEEVISTEGGAYIEGQVQTGGGDFVGRDKVVHVYTRSDKEELDAFVREAVLAYQSYLNDLTWAEPPSEPYKYLSPFGSKDREIFFGRERALDGMYDALLKARLTVLHGRSGAGKSSLLNAGLGPHLLEHRHLPIFARTYNDPVSAIIDAIANRGTPPRPRLFPVLPLRDFLHLVVQNMGRRITALVIILDQFEEMFIRVPLEERLNHLDALADCIEDNGLPLRFVFAVRGDFFSQLAEFEERLPSIFDNRFYLRQLTTEEAKVAITGPVKQVASGVIYDEALLRTVLEVLARDEMDLPELQILCTHLYGLAKEQGVTIIGPELYQEAGGAQGILGGYLEQALEKLPLEQRGIAWHILTELVDSLGQRRVVTQSELRQQIACAEEPLNRVLTRLVTSRLVQRGEGDRYELVHDYLAATIRDRISQEELGIKQIRELLQREVASWLVNRSLMSRDRLELIDEHRPLLKELTAEEIELIFRSAVAHQFAIGTWALAAHQNGIDIWPILQPALNAQNHHVRASVIALLPVVGEAALPALRDALTDAVPLVRVQAILALERLDPDEARQAIQSNPQRQEIYVPLEGEDEGFYIDRYPVTNEAYELFLRDNPDREPPPQWHGRSAPQRLRDHPAVGVSWQDAQAYAAWAGKRLPTVEEWQHAAGIQDGRRYPWGDWFTPGRCNTREAEVGGTTPIDQYSPGADSPYGVADMAGNVWEWLADEAGPEREYRKLRGGSWFYSAEFARINYDHFWRKPEQRQDIIGFRLCFSVRQNEDVC